MKNLVGYCTVEIIDQQNDLKYPMAVMYPTLSSEKPECIGPYSMSLAVDAIPKEGKYPLIIISHGSGGSHLNYLSLAYYLASNGFIIGIPEYPFNNRKDNSLEGTVENLINRPYHTHIAINWFYESKKFSQLLQIDNVSIIGNSMGGYTALAIAGGIPTPLPNESLDKSNLQLSVTHDTRIKALVLLAPATVWFSQPGALSEVKCPILIYVGTKDNITGPECPILLKSGKKDEFMPYGYHVKLVLRGVPNSTKVQCKIIENAGHFSFLSPFPKSMVNSLFLPSQDPAGFDRKDFHDKLNAEVLDFLLCETSSSSD